jgi:hypothetical protein
MESLRMTIGKTLILASAVILGASSMALAQKGPTGGTGQNAATSGVPGTHAGAMRRGPAANSKNVYEDQNGHQQ